MRTDSARRAGARYSAKRRAWAAGLGLCVRCYVNPAMKYRHCLQCRCKQAAAQRKRDMQKEERL